MKLLPPVIALFLLITPVLADSHKTEEGKELYLEQRVDFLESVLGSIIKNGGVSTLGTCNAQPIDKCCCKVGSYGTCTTRNECLEEFGGTCVNSAPGCG